jgi:hypothetical protein
VAPYNESKLGTFHLLGSMMINSAVTNRTIYRSPMPYLKKYSRLLSSCPDPLTSGGKLDKVLRNGLNASADNTSVSGFLKFADRKVNAFPHFLLLAFRSRGVSLPTHGDQKLKNQTLADGACLLISYISSLGGNVSQARVAHLVWLHDDLSRSFLYLLFAFVALLLFFYFFFSSSSCTATHERRKKQNRKLMTTLNTCEVSTIDAYKGSNDGYRVIHSLSISKLRSKSNSILKSKSSSTDRLKKKKILNDDSKLSKSNNELMRNQRQKLNTERRSKITTERNSSGRGRRSRGSTQRRQRGRYYLVQQSSRQLRIARNNKKKKRYKKNKKKEKIMKLKLFHHYKMNQEMFDLINGSFSSRLCLLIFTIFLVSTFCLSIPFMSKMIFEHLFVSSLSINISS